jgi:NNP family nitrate/nitrite transporter-like MFS transporter
MMVTSLFLSMPGGYIVLQTRSGPKDILPYEIGLWPFAIAVFLLGCAMGVGKAAVFKHIPEYFPDNVGPVGGLVGMLGGLGGFFLPPLFAYTEQWSGFPTSTFFVLFLLTAVCLLWMHLTVVRMLHEQSPELSDKLEPSDGEQHLDRTFSGTPDQTDSHLQEAQR